MDTVRHPSPQRTSRDDEGFTLIEMLIVLTIMGTIVAALSMAFLVIVKVNPSTELRIDDARTTRGLATWLSHDTTSAPRFEPEQAEGGIDTSSGRNDCGAPGSNILHLTWFEESFLDREYVANYRFVIDGAEATIVRYTCSRTVPSVGFSGTAGINLTSGLDPATPPLIVLNRNATSEVESVDFFLTAISGESVLLQTGSRNPTDSF